MEEKHKYHFTSGFETVEEGEETFRYLRLRGRELAKELGKPVTWHVYNECIPRWETLGTDYPDGRHINSFGDLCEMLPDGSGYKVIKYKQQV